MSNRRRQFLKTTTAAGMLGFMPKAFSAAEQPSKGLSAKLEKLMNAPALRAELPKEPVKIEKIELLKNGSEFLVLVRAAGGATGIAAAHSSVMATTYPIFVKRIAPFFVGKDARDLESLIHSV